MRFELGERSRLVIDVRSAVNGDAKFVEEHLNKINRLAL